MKIAVRMDDISHGMDWDKFYTFYNILKKYDIKPLLGVVPANQDPNLNISLPLDSKDFFDMVKKWENEGCVIAMHGYSHVYLTTKGGLFPLNNFSEFAGLSFEKQESKVAAGKQILEEHGIYTDIFMAPAHSYDKNTLCVLKKHGFKNITDGFGRIPYERKKMFFFPISFSRKKTLSAEKGYSTLVFHTNSMSEEDMKKWDNFFSSNKEKFISYSEYMQLSGKKRNWAGSFVEWVMAKTKFILMKIRG